MVLEFMDDRPLTEKERATLRGTVRHEARPDGMAIWRAVLAGREGFWRCRGPEGAKIVRRQLLRGGCPLPPSLAEHDTHFTRLGASSCLHEPWRPYRFVLFTHPFTGGRAVYSEPVD